MKTSHAILLLLIFVFFVGCTSEKTTADITDQITKEETERITQQETERITAEETKRITEETTQGEIERITEERTKEITAQITGGTATTTSQLKEVECDATPTKRQFNSNPYYTGPLIDAHLHMPSAFKVPSSIAQQVDWDPPVLEQDVFAGSIACNFDKENIKYAFGFYIVTGLLTSQSVQVAKQFEVQHPETIIPFIMPAHVSSIDLKLEKLEEILNSNKDLFKGYGEMAFYKGSYKALSPDDAEFLEIYKIADRHDLIVMIHPDSDNKQGVEEILKDNPNLIFLFHGWEMEPWLADILDKYPNAYYSIDASLSELHEDPAIASIYNVGNKEEFVREFTANYDEILDSNVKKWKPLIEKYPDRFLWGTDFAYDWHFDEDTGALLEEMGRSFIGQLKPEVQEKFAYKNAEKLLEER